MLCGNCGVRTVIPHLKEINTYILEGQESSPVEMALAFKQHYKSDSNRKYTEGQNKIKLRNQMESFGIEVCEITKDAAAVSCDGNI